MACASTSLTVESYEDEPSATATGMQTAQPVSRRRHSSFHHHSRRVSTSSAIDFEEGLLLKVDQFLEQLERRLDVLEGYEEWDLDTGIARAFATLQAVRARCSQVSGEVLDAGRRRAKVMVETVESRYQDALVAKDTLEDKVLTGILLLEEMLSDFESHACKLRDQGFSGAAHSIIDGGQQVLHDGIAHAREVVDEGIERAIKAAETLEEGIARAVTRAREHGLIRYIDLPEPWQVNPHIVRGYRFSENKISCIRSIFGVSNEMVNIWSHLLGFLIVCSIAFYFYPNHANFSLASKTDIFIAAVFFFAAAKCLVCSTLWHTMNCVADRTLLERFACVDYTGISLLIAASIMTTEYTAFYCEPFSRNIWLISTGTLGVGGVILPWHPTFNRHDLAWARVAFYVLLGATGFVPALQLSLTRGPDWAWSFYAPITKSIVVYLTGAVVYASKVPERWCPGAFDYFGGSHNLWHLAVLGGILFHYKAMEQFFAGAFERAIDECAWF